MSDLNTLVSRVDAEFSALEEKHKKARTEQAQAYLERKKRVAQLSQVFDRLREVWKPRLDVLVKKFGDRVQVTPRLVPSTREATFEFQSKRARIRLKFAARTDQEVTRVVLSYDLEILPVLTRFEAHSEIDFPLEAVDPEAVARWVDDRIVSFVKTYLSLHEEDHNSEEMVEDPVVGIRFPRSAAGATLERKDKTYYFVSEETRREFEKQ